MASRLRHDISNVEASRNVKSSVAQITDKGEPACRAFAELSDRRYSAFAQGFLERTWAEADQQAVSGMSREGIVTIIIFASSFIDHV